MYFGLQLDTTLTQWVNTKGYDLPDHHRQHIPLIHYQHLITFPVVILSWEIWSIKFPQHPSTDKIYHIMMSETTPSTRRFLHASTAFGYLLPWNILGLTKILLGHTEPCYLLNFQCCYIKHYMTWALRLVLNLWIFSRVYLCHLLSNSILWQYWIVAINLYVCIGQHCAL